MVRYYIYFIATLEVETGIGLKMAHIPQHIKYFIFLFIFHRKKSALFENKEIYYFIIT